MKQHYFLLFACLILLLTACTPSPEEAAWARAELANAEDNLAECRMLVSDKHFSDNLTTCQAFLEKDEHCALFPEQKEGCLAFLNATDYSENRLRCQSFTQFTQTCETVVKEKFHSYIANLINFIAQKEEENWVDRVKTIENDILIGVVRSGYGGRGSFIQGVQLALNEVNQQGGVLGRQLTILDEQTNMDLDRSRAIAEQMRDNPRIRAVIGRQFSTNTIPVTYVYENSQIVYLAVSAIMRNVIRYESRFIFRLLPNSNDFANALVAFFIQQQYQRLALLYSRDIYNEEVAYAFRDYAVAKGLTIVYEKSFFDYQQNFAAISADMKELDIDAIFLTTFVDTAIRVIDDMHDLGIKTPIIGSDTLDSKRFAETLGSVGNGIVIPTIYNPFSKKSENASFVNAYRKAYGTNPDTWSAQGYDAIQLLAYAITEANSTIPTNIATALRYMPPQKRASGDFVFKKSGELENKGIYFKELQNGEFVLFKDRKQEAEQSQNIELVNDRIFWRPEKPSESTEALSIQ